MKDKICKIETRFMIYMKIETSWVIKEVNYPSSYCLNSLQITPFPFSVLEENGKYHIPHVITIAYSFISYTFMVKIQNNLGWVIFF